MAGVNPFWSQDVRERAELTQARPEDLPMVESLRLVRLRRM